MTISPIFVESRTFFQDSVETWAGMDVAVVITDVPWLVPVLTGDADCWVHPAARRNAAMSTHASSTVRTGDDMVQRWNDKKIEVADASPQYEPYSLDFLLVPASKPEDCANRNDHGDKTGDDDQVSFPAHIIRIVNG